MSNVYLKFPAIEDKDKWLDYVREYKEDNPEANPAGYKDTFIYEKWVDSIEKHHRGEDLKEGWVPSSMYFVMDDDRIVGTLSIRHNLNTDFLSKYGGHIGYGVRPSERRKGYATTLLNLALEKCKELGLERVMVSCLESNIGSAKTIENNCGELEEYVEDNGKVFKKYWINVEEALNNKKSIRRR